MLKSSSTAAIVTAAQVHTDNGRLFRKARREERRAEREKEQRDFPTAKRKSRSLPRGCGDIAPRLRRPPG